MEHLSDASFLGKLLVLTANVRLDWKEIARYKHSNLLGLIVSNEGRKFYNIDTWNFQWCHDIQSNDNQQNANQQNKTHGNTTKQNDPQQNKTKGDYPHHNDTRHNDTNTE